ncbi:HAD family hydrolase [Streptomyces sp. NBC_01221]|uniref:D-glycero-alpha-D-manno-heptose-1,7-bisphosphate 7-phosphatase n=1 Tax=Streptomyces sp. NBC_01221 TaxID=2903782 RepID=UPI0022572F81|nr:HAD family hydrolase [Streptomyces sp. NBC_01221]MCX4791946.1 HAD family hydrolase [Streptomyces sp. NBC_01221]
MRPDEPATPAGTGRPQRRKAVFLDRDSTLTEPRHYPSRPGDLVLQPDVGAALRALQHAGWALVVVTNQSGVARGFLTMNALEVMHERLGVLLAPHRVHLDGIYACPHHLDGTVPDYRGPCPCRKPAPGMLHRAAYDLELDLTRSWTVGDSPCDIAAGRAAGTHTALVGTRPYGGALPDVHCATTAEALHTVLRSHD